MTSTALPARISVQDSQTPQGSGTGLILGAAVQGHGQDAGDGRFADAAMAAEDVAVGGASLLDGVLQGAGDVLLSDDLGEFLRTVFAGQDGVTHGRKRRLYVNVRGELPANKSL